MIESTYLAGNESSSYEKEAFRDNLNEGLVDNDKDESLIVLADLNKNVEDRESDEW